MQMKKRKGFTLIELVIVVAIIGILSLIAVPQFKNITQEAKKNTFEANWRTVKTAVNMYYAEKGSAPTADADLDDYIAGGITGMNNAPASASYWYDSTNTIWKATYGGTLYSYSPTT